MYSTNYCSTTLLLKCLPIATAPIRIVSTRYPLTEMTDGWVDHRKELWEAWSYRSCFELDWMPIFIPSITPNTNSLWSLFSFFSESDKQQLSACSKQRPSKGIASAENESSLRTQATDIFWILVALKDSRQYDGRATIMRTCGNSA